MPSVPRHQPPLPFVHPAIVPPPPLPPRPPVISRPHQLRRVPPPIYHAPPRLHFIHCLPVEILCLIFVIGSEDDSYLPIAVSHVCRTWRQIALHTPSLWRRITLTPHEYMWRHRIYRARACTLDIELLPWRTIAGGIRRSQELNPYTIQWYMHIALPYIAKWRSLEIVYTEYSPYLWRATLAGFYSPAPALEELSLIYRLNDDTQKFLLFSEQAPHLRRVTVDGIRLVWTRTLFGNLTFLDYTHHGFTSGHQAVHDVISILVVCHRLVELRVLFPRGQVARLPSRRDHVSKRAKLSSLARLQLSVDGSDIPFELAHLVTLISTPRLTTLRLVDLGHSYHSFPSLKSFFYVYSLPPTLRSVHTNYGWYDPRMVQPMVQSLPKLAEIILKRPRAPEQVLNVNTRAKSVRVKHRTGSTSRTIAQDSHRHYYRIDQANLPYYSNRV
ncbi:hypothetical protein NLJ89_g3633 [Agrocybe chaxingu]|uniref:F-box domain-containing protein n=1 Tax=Agrocybe chaxingu TaxID=84603 RepID=A0A9W8K496_9AGAR|nr:hypothetical protein NLJ89_g3633 [Agrocybe chaxingu]